MAHIVFKGIDKIYDNNVQAVFDFNLEVFDKEFVVFVGPSGCGKTTTLRMIAGLEDITAGEIYIDGELINDVEPKKRDIAMVFQNYALYPHMTVFDNMAFSLENKKIKKPEIRERVEAAANILGIESYLQRKPKALSGGQRQRVALGRAIVRNSKVFLMDEPLSNLDAKLRVQMRIELIRLHREIGATTIYVTHDQTEAMTMATKLVIMNEGRIQQVGQPEDIYQNPNNLFVASFLGSPQTNLVEGIIKNNQFIATDAFSFEIPSQFQEKLVPYENQKVILSLRAEDIHVEGIVKETYPNSLCKFTLDIKEMLGHDYILYGRIGSQDISIRTNSRFKFNISDVNEVAFDLNKIHFFNEETTNIIV